MRDFRGLSNIALIGFMGTGKTCVGKKLAQKLDLQFVDSDVEIEQIMNMSIPEVFNRFGEIRFRSEENLVIQKLANHSQNTVIASGGGSVVNPINLIALKNSCVVVTLTASPEVIMQRCSKKGNRPLLKQDDTLENVKALLASRFVAYNRGDFIVDTDELLPEEVVDVIVRRLEENGYAKGQG